VRAPLRGELVLVCQLDGCHVVLVLQLQLPNRDLLGVRLALVLLLCGRERVSVLQLQRLQLLLLLRCQGLKRLRVLLLSTCQLLPRLGQLLLQVGQHLLLVVRLRRACQLLLRLCKLRLGFSQLL
jgi:hypothetical protein